GTADTVSAEVFGSLGIAAPGDNNNVITVGGSSGLTGINENTLPGAGVHLGPLVVFGGSGYDTLIVDESADSAVRSGVMDLLDPSVEAPPVGTPFVQGTTTFVEVGKIIGLGMSDTDAKTGTGDTHGSIAINNLSIDTSNLFIGEVVSGSGIAAGTVITNIVDSHAITISKPTLSRLTSTSLTFSDGELMFESIDTVQVKLGGGDQTHFTINNTITGMTAVTGGTAGDILDVVGTN